VAVLIIEKIEIPVTITIGVIAIQIKTEILTIIRNLEITLIPLIIIITDQAPISTLTIAYNVEIIATIVEVMSIAIEMGLTEAIITITLIIATVAIHTTVDTAIKIEHL
jgi:hypothetical protein